MRQCTALATALVWIAVAQIGVATATEYLPGSPKGMTLEPGMFLIFVAAIYFVMGILEDLAADLIDRRQAWKATKNTDGSAGLLSSPASVQLQFIW